MDTRKHDKTYWACQLTGWSVYAISGTVIASLFNSFTWPWIILGFMIFALGLGSTHLLRVHVQRRRWTELPLRRLAPRVIAASITIAILIVAVVGPVQGLVSDDAMPQEWQTGVIVASAFNWSATILGWSLIYFAVQYFRNLKGVEAEKWRLVLAVREAELAMLRSQLNPHFLFNSLNSVRALIVEDPRRAQDAVTQLAALLRYTLHVSGRTTAPLASEIDTVKNYLALEGLRFEKRLRYSLDIDPDCLETRIPPMLVQTLVENAIKHGIAKERTGGEILLSARRTDDQLRIRVSNTGRLDPSTDTGVGLTNSIDRLRLLFGEKANLRLFPEADQRVTAEVLLPLQPQPETKPKGENPAAAALAATAKHAP